MPTGSGGGRRSTRRRWSRIAPRPRCSAPMASLEDTKDMRARIRALSAVLAVIGLVAPVPTFAQDPPTATVSTPQARTAVPPGGTLNLSLDEAVAAGAGEQRRHRGRALQPRVERAGPCSPARATTTPTCSATSARRRRTPRARTSSPAATAVNTKTDVWNFGLGIPIKTGANFTLGFNNNRRDTNNTFSDLQPGLQLQPHHRRHPAASEELQDRQPPEPAETRQEEPRDHRRAVSPDDHQHRGRR